MLLAMNILGYENFISWIPEFLLRKFFYRDLQQLAPPENTLYEETPMCNDEILARIRSGDAEWLRGDPIRLDKDGFVFNHRQQGVPKQGPGKEINVPGDIVICATGFTRPSLRFLPQSVFEDPYAPPAWYLQSFPPGCTSLAAINCTYINAIGTVGNIHIGLYARLLLTFLRDPSTRPSESAMKRWITVTRWLKARSPTGAFEFFTYSELLLWFIECCLLNPYRWRWIPFILLGWDMALRP